MEVQIRLLFQAWSLTIASVRDRHSFGQKRAGLFLVPRSFFVPTSKAPVTTSVALVMRYSLLSCVIRDSLYSAAIRDWFRDSLEIPDPESDSSFGIRDSQPCLGASPDHVSIQFGVVNMFSVAAFNFCSIFQRVRWL